MSPRPLRAALAGAVGAVVALTGVAAAHAATPAPGTTPAARAVPAVAERPTAGTTDRMIIRYRTPAPAGTVGAQVQAERRERVERAAADRGLAAEHVRDMTGGAQVWALGAELPVADVAAVAQAVVAADSAVEYAEPDRVLWPLAAPPDDPRFAEQWSLQASSVGIDLLAAWDVSRGAGVRVAVIDTGYRPHADLAANVVGGYDMISDTAVSNDGNLRDADASDPGDWTVRDECEPGWPGYGSSWHGTHVAGTVSAVTGNGVGVSGVAPEAKVVPLRVLGQCGGYTSDIADAMVWASGGAVSGLPANPNPARVLNLSLGGSGTCDTTSQRAITTARANGAVVVVAAGNENTNVSTSSPANCSGVVAVAAYGPSGARAYYSNYGTLVDVAAPGGDQSGGAANGILSTLNSGTTTPGSDTYASYQGTSMAAPHVAGVAALMVAANPSLTPDQVESLLRSTARPFVVTCSGCGTGMLDADAAVRAAVGGTTPPPASGTTESEPNDTRATADVVSTKGAVTAAIGSSTDTDYFAVAVPAGATLTATLTPGATSDQDLYLYNASGTRVARSTAGTGAVDSVSYRNRGSATATFYVRVLHYSGPTGAYGLQLSW